MGHFAIGSHVDEVLGSWLPRFEPRQRLLKLESLHEKVHRWGPENPKYSGGVVMGMGDVRGKSYIVAESTCRKWMHVRSV